MVLAVMDLPHHQMLMFFVVPTFLKLFIGHLTILNLLQEEIRLLSNYQVHQEMSVLVTLNLVVTPQAGAFSCLSRFILYCILLIMLGIQHLILRMPAVGAAGPQAALILWMFLSQFLIGIITLPKHNK
jgi:hypothetical protein